MGELETDYLVVGAGAAGMAFTDSLIASSDADVTIVDRRAVPGGHWNDAYPFVRLHQPSAYYGVNSRVLGTDAIDEHGDNAGFYHRATAPEICGYFQAVLRDHLLASGRVRFLGMTDHSTTESREHRLVSRLTGEQHRVTVRRKLVDATYLETPVPATHVPDYDVHPDVRLIPVGDLTKLESPCSTYVIIGGGKTSMDACVWLLDNGVDPDRIRWIRPRDSWLLDRVGWQPLDQVVSIVEGVSLELEAAANAESLDDLLARLEACGRLVRIDPDVTPTMYHCAIVSQTEIAALRRVRDVVRLGHVVRIDPDRIVLEHGTIDADLEDVYVDCTAAGLRRAPARPIFESDRITLQQVRFCSPTFNAALVAYVEATRDDLDEQNRLCPPNRYPDTPADWMANFVTTITAATAWMAEADVMQWCGESRLNLLKGMFDHPDDARMQAALQRYVANLNPALQRLQALMEPAQPVG